MATTNVVNNSVGEPTHGGSWDAWLNGLGASHTDTLTQQVAIPGGMSQATLSFYLHIDTADTTASAHDKLRVQVTTSTGVVLTTLATYSNLDQAAGNTLRSLDMTPYIGQTVKIKFSGVENATLQTSFVVDDAGQTHFSSATP